MTESTTLDAHDAIALAMLQGEQCEARKDGQRALLHYLQVLAQDPAHVDAWCRLGRLFAQAKEWGQSIQALDTALQLRPGLEYARKLLAVAYLQTGRVEEAAVLIEDVASTSGDASVWSLRAQLLSMVEPDPVRTRTLFEDWGRRFADPLSAQALPFEGLDRDPQRRLKIAYVTGDFREHSIAFFMQPVLAHHDAQAFEVHVFSSGAPDAMTARLRALVPHWHDVLGWTDDAVYDLVRAQRIDVLIDLSGHTADNRLMVFARRAAPVQVTWLGYMHTLGMQAMDWRLTDHGSSPAGHDDFYTETLYRLACMACYSPPPSVPLRAQPPMMDNGFPTLISLNNSLKISDDMLRLWARILDARTDARLIVMVKENTQEAAQAVMRPRLLAAGLPPERVSLLPHLPLQQFMQLGTMADIALDTAPISGGTTTMHALWMGLPVVAMDAERAIDAASARTLAGIGLAHLVACDAQSYVALALSLLQDADALLRQRAAARTALQSSVLMDYGRRAAELEQALRLMWANFIGGHAPRAMDGGWDLTRAQAGA